MSYTLRALSTFVVIAVWPATALAYIDPGTGSILIQGIIAAIAAIGVTLKLYWHQFVALFRRRPADELENEKMKVAPNADFDKQNPSE